MDDRGSAGMLVFAVLAFLGACLLGVSAYVGGTLDYGRRNERERSIRLSLYSAARETLDLLSEDATPESDGPRDSIWSSLGGRADGVTLSLSDASSRLNVNFTSVEMLGKTDFLSLFAPGTSPEYLASYRSEKGLSTELSHYEGIFADEALPSLSCFGWANVNVADRAALRALYLSLTSDADGADAFSLRIEAARTAKRVIGAGALESFLGSAYRVIYPTICAEAQYNVNFASFELIRSILSYQPFGIADPSARAEAIVAARADHDLVARDIAALCGASSNHALLQYLGARTWFWTLRAAGSGRRLGMTVGVWPEAGTRAGKARRLTIVETRFDP
jgi:hypothetical protein